ncbi:MAG: IS110 family transposase [Methylocystaceae bacterium]|jgi:transposase|nr:IS110 family transposase [Methylocystaceae bacterium]
MLDHTHQNTKPTIYAAIELSKKSWVVAILRPNKDQPSIHRVKGGDVSELIAKLRGAAAHGERLLICYEAGYDGFWLARSLDRAGIDCRVLDPASLQVNRRARRVKTDRLDVLMLVRALVAVDRGDRHVCSIVRVPTIEEEDARRSHRERQRLIRERTAHINRIKGLFFGQGIRGIEPLRKRSRVNLSEIRTAEGVPLPARLRAEIEREFSRFDHVEEQLKAVEAERDTADAQNPAVNKKREMLIRLRGLGPASAAILSREVFGRSFANRKQLGSYLGLTPSAYDSGSSTRCQGISKSGNSHARHMMIEVAWLWLKYQPQSALAKWFAQRAAGQSPRIRRIMLIALARKLIVSLWHYVEAGIVPEGAVSVVEGAATA